MARSEYYIVRHDQSAHQELKGNGENPKAILRPRLDEQIPSYMGEFVLDVNFKEFSYQEVVNEQTGQKELHATGFIGEINKSYDKAICDAKLRGWSGRREEAECEGFKKLEKQLFNSPEGTFYLWISPPGPKEESYGIHSFTHLGQIQKTAGGRRIAVTSLKNRLSLKDHAKIINYFLPEEEKLENPKDVDFLRNPVVIAKEGRYNVTDLLVSIDKILKMAGNHSTYFSKAYQERKEWEKAVREALQPLIEDYYLALERDASGEELQKRMWAMENYTRKMTAEDVALPIREGTVSHRDLDTTIIYQRYSYQPEALSGGGCPSGNSNPSENPLASSALLPWQEHKLENSSSTESKKTLECTCPNCQKKVKAVIENGKIHCPACGVSAPYKC